MKKRAMFISAAVIMVSAAGMTACAGAGNEPEQAVVVSDDAEQTVMLSDESELPKQEPDEPEEPSEQAPETETEELAAEPDTELQEATEPKKEIAWDPAWEYADYSKIHDDTVMLYRSEAAERKDFVVAVNAGHGTSGGAQVKTLCHPDGSAKVVSGSTSAGATEATAVSGGMTFTDGTSEASANLSLAILTKDELLAAGYDVLMIRESDDAQLDNIARTVFANQYADCHIALHYDSTETDKGAFYIGVPDADSYRSMEPVASHWQEHEALGQALISGMRENDIPVYGEGRMAIDLTQTSYSTIPSIDLEVGDRTSDHSESTQREIAKSIVRGVDSFR